MNEGQRLHGRVVSLHASGSRYGGSYGEIEVGGEYYVFSGAAWFRNFSIPEIGAQVTFEVVAYTYATNIDRIDKRLAVFPPPIEGAK